MANAGLVSLLLDGRESWNKWILANRNAQLDFTGASLSKANLRDYYLSRAYFIGANLSYADLSYVDLNEAYLGSADLTRVNLSHADLRDADLRGATLSGADLRGTYLVGAKLFGVNFSNADLRGANLNGAFLSNADLRGATLSEANLSGVDLCGTTFHHTNLSKANLKGVQVLRANFTKATLTGACIADWQIGSSTILEGVKCDYIFRTYDIEKQLFSGRLPVDPDSAFAPGEFTQRFQIIASALETIDITFTEGIDWQAFFQSFQELRDSHPDEEISIQGMERKGNAFVVRLEVAAEADKGAVETEVKQLYAHQLVAMEAHYQEQLRLQSEEIAMYRQTQSSLLHIVQTMAEKDAISQTFNAPVGNVAGNNHGKMQNIQHIYAPEQQDLSEAAQEIQKLLNTLAETYNTTSETGQAKLMQELGEEIEKHPKWRRALKEGGIELIKVLCAPIGIPLEMARVYLEDNE